MSSPTISLGISLVCAFTFVVSDVRADDHCADPEFCEVPPVDDCFDDDVGDTCNPNPPEPCEPTPNQVFVFEDDDSDGQLMSLNRPGSYEACGTLTVNTTGYYSIFDAELSESCDDQQDETGYLKITNSCNTAGWPTVHNAGLRYLVADTDNTGECVGNPGMCAAGTVCRSNSHGSCCVPDQPVFMGTFLLVEGEPNRICLNHWCPEWEADPSLGFVNNGCGDPGSVNSIHFQINTNALACEEVTDLQECSFGCFDGSCAADPCDDAQCPNFCQDGVCTDNNPCADLDCEFGCVNGLCLQAPDTPGMDHDGDGFSKAADCDDDNAEVNPGAIEICANNIDDNCNGQIDEDCNGAGGADGGSGDGSASNGGCGCQSGSGGSGMAALILLTLVLFVRRRSVLL